MTRAGDRPSTPPPVVRGSGSGKLILFGEHAVVWGVPAIASSLPRGAVAELRVDARLEHDVLRLSQGEELLATLSPDERGAPLEQALAALCAALKPTSSPPLELHVTLNVPAGAGLGSSAAMATAIGRALLALDPTGEDDEARLERAVARSEGIFHATASGIDQRAALGSGLFRYEKGPPRLVTPIALGAPLHLVVAQAAPGASTAQMVQGVSARRAAAPARYERLAAVMRELVDEATEALQSGDVRRLGELMDFNHGLLDAIGVSTSALDTCCHVAREAGALGAKLTGAGGGGCMVALATDEAQATDIASALEGAALSTQAITLSSR